MATLPSPTQISGQHNVIYEAYYNAVDPKGIGSIGGMEAARFLKKSGLSDVILSKIWDLSDPGGRGCLDKTGMFVALKLVALVQNGKELNVKNVQNVDVPPPKMGDTPLPKPQKPQPPPTPLITSLPPSAVDWSMKATEKEKYEKLFESLQPVNGLIAGNKVKNVLMESKLPVETLGKIWDLADQDRDGMLDRFEFVAAMHLVYKALDKFAIPNTLPLELKPPSKIRRNSSLSSSKKDGVKHETVAPSSLIMPTPVPVPPPAAAASNWVVSNEEKIKSDSLFIKSDVDKDGFVSGMEIKDVFLQSGVPQQVLAHIWALCDIKQSGKLNNEQFALAMWLVARCLKGIDPPPSLTPEMVPPSFRGPKSATDGVVENNNTKYSNPELEMISKDIEQLSRERLTLETEITQKEADIRIRKSEITSLQSELDTLAATLKQLENQKGEAQKRLNDLKAQVDKLRSQAAEQAATVAAQETELNTKKQQHEGLKQEEDRLSRELSENAKTLENLTSSMQESQLNISQAKALQTQLEEQTRQLNDAIRSCDSAISSDEPSLVNDTLLRISPDFRQAKVANSRLVNGTDDSEKYKDDPFSDNRRSSGFDRDPFQSGPFDQNSKNGGFGSTDAFQATFGTTIQDGFSDPFGGSTDKSLGDPFDAFGDSKTTMSGTTPQEQFDKDAFGCDPFAILHAPTRDGSTPNRPTSPSPALPPKKSKQPPPRPAPPRPQPPKKAPSNNDPFGGDSFGSTAGGGGGGFADFSDFDAKLSKSITTATASTATSSQVARTAKGLEFVEDPFRDYRYEDPFNISFEEDDDNSESNSNNNNNMKKSKSVDAFAFKMPLTSLSASSGDKNDNDEINRNKAKGFEDKFDPFDGRQSAPPVQLKKSSNNVKVLSEDQQLAWAAAESLKLEKERKARLLQEEAELKLAINLSRAESRKH